MATFDAFPGLGNWPGSVNIHIENGRAMPAFDHGAMSGSADVLHYFLKEAIETTNPSGNPRQYAFANKSVYYHEDGVITTDVTFTDIVQGAQIVEGPPYTNGVGVKKLMVVFGNSSAGTETTRLRTLTTDTTPWTAAISPATATQAMMWGPIVLSDGSVIAATGASQSGVNLGRTTLGEYFIGKCKRGDDPTLAASYGNIQATGSPEWPINGLAPLFDSFVVSRGDGPVFWNDRTKRFQPILPNIRFLPHALNGKGLTAGDNCIWIPMADGRLFAFDGSSVSEETPWKQWKLSRDMMTTRITAVADRGDVVAVRTEAFYNSVSGPVAAAALGMRVFTSTGVTPTITEITSAVTDGSLSNGANLGTFGANVNDKLVIGLNQPAEGFLARVAHTGNTNASAVLKTPQCSDGAGGWTSLGTIVDFTALGTAASLAVTGFPPGASQAYLGWSGNQSYDLSKTDTFNGITGLYWYRFGVNAAAAMTSPIIDEIEPIESRGGLPNTGLLTSALNYSHRDRAGGIGHVYIGRRIGGRIVWTDEYAINDFGGCWAMAWTTARSGTMTNGGQPLLLWGRAQQTIIAESITRDPARTPFPKLVPLVSTKPPPTMAFHNIALDEPGSRVNINKRKKLNFISVRGEGVQPTDKMSCYAWWDHEDKAYELDTVFGSPMTFAPPAAFPPTGRILHFELVFSDVSQNDPMAPCWTQVTVDYDIEPGDVGRDSAWTTPESV